MSSTSFSAFPSQVLSPRTPWPRWFGVLLEQGNTFPVIPLWAFSLLRFRSTIFNRNGRPDVRLVLSSPPRPFSTALVCHQSLRPRPQLPQHVPRAQSRRPPPTLPIPLFRSELKSAHLVEFEGRPTVPVTAYRPADPSRKSHVSTSCRTENLFP